MEGEPATGFLSKYLSYIIAAGVGALVVLLAVLICCLRKRKDKNRFNPNGDQLRYTNFDPTPRLSGRIN